MARHIVCITKNGTNPAYEGARVGARRIAEAVGCDMTSLYPETPDDAVEQTQLLKEALALAPDAIMISVADPKALDPLLTLAKERGIPVVSFVSRSTLVAPDCFVTSDNFTLAQAIARRLFAEIGGFGSVAIIEGNPASETSAPRTEGFLAAMSNAPGIRLAGRAVGYYQREPAQQAMSGLLNGGGGMDGVLVANDFMALGVIDALRDAGLEVPVVSVNAMPQAVIALRSGELLATAAFDAMKIACAGTLATLRLLEGQPVPRQITLPVDIVDRTNCAPWGEGYEDRPLPNWQEVMAAT
ncbi:sugar ABC transporter substrate-binding protein [Alloyangia pacifica]|uniref:sugar ABC transporter substrate-binding protein n=1 Tax=Alloyangia pacifica TaxID=311180 RepID=UPI001CFE4584|nr:sugar ABC transporter substrate-binding protein [Alloyangia pacifica]